MLKTLFSSVAGLFSGWTIYIILALVASNAFFYALWKDVSKEVIAFETAGKIAKEEKDRVETQHNETLKEVTNAWEKYSKDSTRRALAAYDAKHSWATCVQPSTVQVPVPGNANGSEILHGPESERRTCTAEFIGACVDDAAFRILVRRWTLRNQLPVEK